MESKLINALASMFSLEPKGKRVEKPIVPAHIQAKIVAKAEARRERRKLKRRQNEFY